jgi:CheY-like chemotaxis protein
LLRTVIVDDSEDVRSLWSAALDQSGEFEVCGVAVDGASAVEIVRREQPDVVLLDLSMPGLHGLETLPLLQEVSPDTRVAVVSSASRREFADRATALGACGFLEKHLPLQSLAPRLLQLVSQSHADGTSETPPHPDVLLVESDPARRELLEYLIGWLPYRARLASNAVQGLAMMHRAAPSAVLIDPQRSTGVDALRDLISACASAGIPVIFLGPADTGPEDRGLPTGVVEQLPEPVTSEELDVVLRRWASPHATAHVSPGAVAAARAALTELIDELGQAPASRAWIVFARTTADRSAAAQRAVRAGDLTALALVAHAVRGSAATIGLSALAGIGADLEAAARLGDLDRATALVVSLQEFRDAIRSGGAAAAVPGPRAAAVAEQFPVDHTTDTDAHLPRRRLLKWFGAG